MLITHIANPVRVSALAIVKLAVDGNCGGHVATLSDASQFHITAAMESRHVPVEGDYVVTQEDGYVYVNPKDVFERKYRLFEPTLANSGEALAEAFAERDNAASPEIATRDQRIAELELQLAAARSREGSTELQVRVQVMSMMMDAARSHAGIKQIDEVVQYVLTGNVPGAREQV